MNWLLGGLFWLSRVAFWNWGEVMFDSKEYLIRWSNPNLALAIANGHPPLHAGYVLAFWPIFQVFKHLGLEPALGVMLGQTVLAFLTLVYFYKLVGLWYKPKTAITAALLLSVLPVFWLVNEVIMMETTYLCFWTISFYYLVCFVQKRGGDGINLSLAGLFWMLAFLTHTVVILWIPLYLWIVWLKRPESLKPMITVGGVTLFFASVINAYFLSLGSGGNLIEGWYLLYGAKFNEHAHFSSWWLGILRYGRNWLVPLGYNNTWVMLVVAGYALAKKILKNNREGITMLLWILPSIIANQWWDSLLYGRHALIASLALVILVAEFIKDNRFRILWVIIFGVALYGVAFLKQPIPYLGLAEAVKGLPKNGLYVESHFARPQVDGKYPGKTIFVDEPGFELKNLGVEIEAYLREGKPVMISGQALSEPYGLFCGPVLHNLSLSYKNPSILSELVKNYRMEEIIRIDPTINLVIYQIVNGEGEMPMIIKLNNSARRLDYPDPLRWLIANTEEKLGLFRP